MKAHHRRTSFPSANRQQTTTEAKPKSDWLKVTVRPSVPHVPRVGDRVDRRPLDALFETPERILEVPLEQIRGLVAEVASEQAALSAIQGALTVRLLVTPDAPGSGTDGDRLLTAAEVARLLGVTKRWVQRRARRLPFAPRISVRSVRYSETGLRRWMTNRQIRQT
jgi:predicted DNA-binding transcriptional regulator AlpA